MQRVRRTTAIATLPPPPSGGTPGFFAAPNPQAALPATVPGYEWYNNVQEEILAVIEGQGMTPSDTDRTQLRQAIQKMVKSGQRSVVIGSAVFANGVATGHVVYWDAGNNCFDKALSNGSAKQNAVGVADVPNAQVYAFGDAILFSGLTPGARYYLDPAISGAITTTAPANGVYIGIARTATEVFIDIDGLYVQSNQANSWTMGQSGAPKDLPATTGTIALDLAQSNNWKGTATGNLVLANPASMPAGQSGVISITQPATPVSIAYGAWWKPADGVSLPALTQTAGAVDDLVYYVESPSRIVVGRIGGAA